MTSALHRRFPELQVEEVRELVDRHGADEGAASVALAAASQKRQAAREAAAREEQTRRREEQRRRQEAEKQRSDPTMQLRRWLRSAGLAAVEYPLVDLDRMGSLAELLTWSLEDLQLLNLTDAERFALHANLQSLRRQEQDAAGLREQLEGEEEEEEEEEDELPFANSNAAAAEAAEKAAAAAVADTEEEEEDEEGEASIASRFPRKSAEGKLVRWMGQSKLEHLAPPLLALGIRSKGQLLRLSEERLEALPLSIAQRDALARMLAAKRDGREEAAPDDNSPRRAPAEDADGVPNFRRPLCKSYLGNSCSSGIKCRFLHSRPCKFTESGKKCPFAELCPYLHPHDKGYASARERPCRFVAAGQKCHLGDKCHYLHNIHGWRIEADLQGGAPAETGGGASAHNSEEDEDSDQRQAPAVAAAAAAMAESRKCSACGVASTDWEGHVATAGHRERLFGRVKSVLERGLDIKEATTAMVLEAFGSWKALAGDRPDLFYLEQGVIKLRKVANSLQGGAAPAEREGGGGGGGGGGGKRHRHKK